MPFVNNNGVRIHYQIEGDGPTVIVHHGMFGNLELWREVGLVSALENDYRLVLLDARGHGKSDKPHDAESYSWDLLVSDVVSVADHFGIERFNYLGFSMGGVCAYYLAKFSPDRLNSLIIGGAGTGNARFESFRGIDGSDSEEFIAAFEVAMGEVMSAEARATILSNDIQAIAAAIAARRVEESIKDVPPGMRMPCLVYAGENDKVFESAKVAADQMPHGRFFPLPGRNHVQTLYDAPELVPEFRSFLKEVV